MDRVKVRARVGVRVRLRVRARVKWVEGPVLACARVLLSTPVTSAVSTSVCRHRYS